MTLGYLSPPRRVLPVSFLGLCLILAAAWASGSDANQADELKQQTDRWIGLQRRTADEANQWRADKETLQTSLDVLRKERETLQGKVDANELATGLFQKRLDQAQSELAEHEAAHAALQERSGALEERIRNLTTRLPEPLQAKIGPMLEKLEPREGEDAPSAAQRTQTLVSVLSAIDLFNNTLTMTHQLRQVEGGELQDIKVLYWGLATGYAIDARGERAWVLQPGASHWEWLDATDRTDGIKTLFAIYEKQQSPQLVELPVSGTGRAAQ